MYKSHVMALRSLLSSHQKVEENYIDQIMALKGLLLANIKEETQKEAFETWIQKLSEIREGI